MVHISRVNLVLHSAKVDTVRQSPVNLDGQDSTKSVDSTISSLLQNTGELNEIGTHERGKSIRGFRWYPSCLWIFSFVSVISYILSVLISLQNKENIFLKMYCSLQYNLWIYFVIFSASLYRITCFSIQCIGETTSHYIRFDLWN